MHSYLLLGNEDKIDIPSSLPKSPVITFEINGIDDVRELKKSLKLAQSIAQIFKLTNISRATEEAQNALLKILEEPPENVYFVLTSETTSGILDTILSRCVVVTAINVENKKSTENGIAVFEMTFAQKLDLISKIQKKDEALVFLKNLIYELHSKIVIDENHDKSLITNLKNTEMALQRINSNGNVFLQLLNFITKG